MTLTSQDILAALQDHPTGAGLRPSFHALWHLEELGVIDDLTSFSSPAWDAAEARLEGQGVPPVRVAVIDTPVAHTHPSLQGAIDLGLMRDFSYSDAGRFVVRDLQAAPATADDVASRDALLAELAQTPSDPGNLVLAELADAAPAVDPSGWLSPLGAHATALAGLIGARPTRLSLREPTYLGATAQSSVLTDIGLPYCGIDPFCRIVPVSISAAGRPGMILAALNYVRLIAPQIVVIADSWEGRDIPEDQAIWTEIEDTFGHLCDSSRVFCAAGNERLGKLVYPASLSGPQAANPGGGAFAGRPWAVGACDVSGEDLSYSPDHGAITAAGFRMIKTLSTELSRYDRAVQELDPWRPRHLEYGRPLGDPDFPPRDIISTD
ncbi:hypothetical protein LCGC14_1924250, partial [marine sediment metagenome]